MKITTLYSTIILWGLSLFLAGCNNTPLQTIQEQSPDGHIKVTMGQSEGKPFYNMVFHSDTLIKDSRLGFKFAKLGDATQNFTLKSVEKSTTDTLWQSVWGEDQYIKEYSNNLSLIFTQDKHPYLSLQIQLRIFNDGIGFRYILPAQKGIDTLLLCDEITQFNLKEDNHSWWFTVDYDSYEKPYKSTKVSQIDSVQTPFTMVTPKGTHISIHEAALVNYSSMTLKRDKNNPLSLECNLIPWPDGIKVKVRKQLTSPWRTIQVGKEAKDLINSNLIVNLNEPSKFQNTSWIHPMKYMGIWWGMHLGQQTWYTGPKHGATTKNTMKLIDFAAKNNFDGVLVEGWNWDWKKFGNWDFKRAYPDFDMDKISQYCKKKNVALIGHHETSGNVELYESQLDSALNYYQHYGITAIKTGYVGPIKNGQYHHGQWMINHYQRVVEEAAKRHICIVAHEPIKPTGLRRTYPNFLSREGALGQEFNAPWSGTNNTPEHTTILPFTRMLAGPMDFTPGIFQLTYEKYGNKDKRVNTTLAKQLALYVILYSPVQMAADLQENYQNHPAFEFIKGVAVDWEQSVAINGEIGQYITMARKERNGNRWFMGSITNEKTRDLTVNLSFLDPNKRYQVTIYADAPKTNWKSNPYPYRILKKEVNAQTNLSIHLAPGGGQAMIITPIIK